MSGSALFRAALLTGAAAAVLWLLPATAAAHTETKTVGSVTATLSWRGSFAETNDFRIAIDRGGARVLDSAVETKDCSEPNPDYACLWPVGKQPLRLRDLDGDGEPEAIVTAFTGGAHCCVIALVYAWNGSAYATFENNFLDPGFRLVDIEHDGLPEFRSADARFAYLYGSFAESVFPILLVRFEDGKFIDVTREFPDTVANDLRRVKREYERRSESRKRLGVRSALAAYVAELYLLDRNKQARRTLRSALRTGVLEPTRFDAGPFGRKFIRNLKRHLRRWDYI